MFNDDNLPKKTLTCMKNIVDPWLNLCKCGFIKLTCVPKSYFSVKFTFI